MTLEASPTPGLTRRRALAGLTAATAVVGILPWPGAARAAGVCAVTPEST
jgi:hypothetical protein